jgi:mannose-1-phosphate guanylyltransferase/mannose-6-phosphate isomerase
MGRTLSIHAVILAGGAGERFWPASRRRHPKPLLGMAGGRSLLEATLDRARRFARGECIWVVCGAEHARAMRAAAKLPAGRVMVEPRRRNTAMAAAWSTLRIATQDPDAVIAVLSADHHVPDAAAFASAMRRGARAARDAGVLVTLGVKPTRPDTGYGYIQEGPPAGRRFPGLRRVKRFVEKPDLPRARRYLARGGYRWNAGIFLWSARTLLEEIETCAPELHRALAPLRRAARSRAAREAAYRRAPSLPIDVAVMERSRRVWTLPVDFSWSDVGTWASLAEELGVGGSRVAPGWSPGPAEREGNRVIAGDVLLEQARGNLVWGEGRLVALLGVENLAVVDTGDVILVTQLDRSSDVRRMVERLHKQGRSELT